MPAAQAITLQTRIRDLPAVGPALAEPLEALGLPNVGRLIAHLPTRYERIEEETPISQLIAGRVVSARGTVVSTRPVRIRKPRFEVVLMDESGRLDIVWFNAMYLADKIHAGARMRVQGMARRSRGALQLTNPRFWLLDGGREPVGAEEARIRPVYPAREGITSQQIERLIARVLPGVLPLLEDHLPEPYLSERRMPALADAYRIVHGPEHMEQVRTATRRLAYDELLLLQLGVHMKRAHLRQTMTAPALKWTDEIDTKIRRRFPFALTPSQDRVVEELKGDLTRDTPANRLIQGDVGSGKTVVALYAMLLAVASGHQAALMAPTEILAEQHFASISRMLEGSKVRVELLTGGTGKDVRPGLLRRLRTGAIDILIGTHALLTEDVEFHSLAVAIIDEQHRFGVHQRAALRAAATTGSGPWDARTPHVLVMTATPIPRTLAITLFGDLDISTIDGLPPGRVPVTTRVVGPESRFKVYGFVRQRIERGDQAYVVVPTIETAPQVGSFDVGRLTRFLREGPLKGRQVAALHARLRPATRHQVLSRFRAGEIDTLVATTVVEVGVDVPNASIMVVEHADRFGLAQLHQLRGRIGRGTKKSVCVLIAEAESEEARARLSVMESTADGFVLAEKDMELRGPGELFGTRQSGMPPFRVADLSRHLDLLKMARRDAAAWIAASPLLNKPEEALLNRRLMKAHGQWLGLGDVG